MFYLCWNDCKNKKRQKKYSSIEDIKKYMSFFLYEGEWVETKGGEIIPMDWESVCPQNLSLF